METVLSNLVKYAPNPLEGKPMMGVEGNEIPRDPNGAPALFVFKTMSDQFGKNSYFQVVSGKLTPDLTLVNLRTGGNEKLGHLYVAKGKKNTEVKELACGDLGVLTKIASLKTNDTLGTAGKTEAIAPTEYEEPCYSMAVYAKVPRHRGQDRCRPHKAQRGRQLLHLRQQRRDQGNGALRRRRHPSGCALLQTQEQVQCGGGSAPGPYRLP